MYIGEVTALTGASAKAIRLYEQLGLLTVARSGRYRIYTQRDVAQIDLIRQAQALGFRLAELATLIGDAEGMSRDNMLALLDQRLANVDQQLRLLSQLRADLEQARTEIATCPEVVTGDAISAEACTSPAAR